MVHTPLIWIPADSGHWRVLLGPPGLRLLQSRAEKGLINKQIVGGGWGFPTGTPASCSVGSWVPTARGTQGQNSVTPCEPEREPGASVLLQWWASLLQCMELATSIQDTAPRVEVPVGGGGGKGRVAALEAYFYPCCEMGIYS